MGKTRYTLINGILYHLGIDQSLQIVLPKQDRYDVFREVHQGKFTGHLQDANIHGQLSKTILVVELGGIIFLLPVYGITNSERYSVFHGI